MFCWSCGHENSDNHKFCGECGRSLYKPEKVVQDITTARNFSRAEDAKNKPVDEKSAPSAPEKSSTSSRGTYLRPPEGTLLSPPVKQPDFSAAPRELEVPKQTNPLIEEPRVVHEKPIPSALTPPPPVTTPQPPTMIRDRVPNRITGPSFLGLSDEGSSRDEDSSYLLDDEGESSSPWRGYLMLALLVVVSLLVIRNWGDIRSFAAEKFGGTDTVKHPAGPERVTASNDASQITPDAAPEEGKTAAPADKKTADDKSDQKDSGPQQSAKLEKPQSDRGSDTVNKSEGTSKNEEDTSDSKPSPAASTQKPAAPAYDNSQLEEAQKYLQGRGVPQDCNRGVSLLRDAAKQPNPKARIQMAALYVSGHCVTEDVTQAYNWFLKAQELEPHNRMIERNLDSLWARMTDEERRKVLR